MLSKSKGQVLRVAAALHVLFKIKDLEDSGEDMSTESDGETGDDLIDAGEDIQPEIILEQALISL
jgi:hypothetical protein